jgi:acyl dehydratase
MELGDRIEDLRVTPDKYLPHRYAGASGDFNPIHIDKEFATAVGLPSNILHGLYGMAQVARALQRTAGRDPRRLKRLSVQFRGMGFPEQEIVVTGSVKAIDDGRAVIEVEAAQGDNRIIRNAEGEIELPPGAGNGQRAAGGGQRAAGRR